MVASFFQDVLSTGTSTPNVDESPSHVVLKGDAFDLIDLIPDSSIDLIITSPPYWGLRTYTEEHDWQIHEKWKKLGKTIHEVPPYNWYREHGGKLGLEPSPDWYVAHLVEFFDKARRTLRSQGGIWVNLGDTYFARWSSIRDKGRQGLGGNPRSRRRVPMGDYRQEKQLLLVPARFAISMQTRRWILRNDLIWFKPNIPPRPERDRLRLSHEHFFHFVLRPTQGRARYFYDLPKVENGGHDVVSCYVRPGQDNHTATFPETLITPRILSSSPEGGTVLDPFCGTGRALAVAIANHRSAVGFDSSQEYVNTATRILKELNQSFH